jgi:hypothetical protein
MSCHHFKLKTGRQVGGERIVTVDTEWAKNWKAKEKIVPFCTCIHSIYFQGIGDVIDIDNLYMESELYFRSSGDSTQDYVNNVNSLLEHYLDEKTTLGGHQFSSDLHTLLQCSKVKLDAVTRLVELFRERKRQELFNFGPRVMDTRYDIKHRMTGNGAEKLRNVSLRLKIFAVQNELNQMSLTKMYNLYLVDGDKEKREKLQVLNWRHAFQTGLVWLVDSLDNLVLYNSKFRNHFLVTNDLMYQMGKDHFAYLNTAEFARSRTLDGIFEYVSKYAPSMLSQL